MTITIRSATVDDAADLADVRVRTWQKAYRGLFPDDILDSFDIEAERQRWQDGIVNLPPDQFVYVAQEDAPVGRVVGYAVCGPNRDPDPEHTAEIYALYVLPEFQGQGIGRTLVQHAARWLKQQGHQRMIIFVLRQNVPSRRFYEAIGGQPAREKTIEIRNVIAEEVGYGYDLSELGN